MKQLQTKCQACIIQHDTLNVLYGFINRAILVVYVYLMVYFDAIAEYAQENKFREFFILTCNFDNIFVNVSLFVFCCCIRLFRFGSEAENHGILYPSAPEHY